MHVIGDGGDAVPIALQLAAMDLQCRWAEALDTRDWVGVRACFTSDVRSELPRTGRSEGIDELLARQRPVLEVLDLTQHHLTNQRVRQAGGELVATCSVIARHQRTRDGASQAYTFGGRYADTVVEVEEGLRIAARRLEIVWTEGDPATLR